jgi:hypothetical protein
MTLFSQTVEVEAKFLGDMHNLKERQIHRDAGQISMSGDIIVTPGFTMCLVRNMFELGENRVVALELTPADDNAEELFANLVELLSPPTNIDIDNDEYHGHDRLQDHSAYDRVDYNCGIVKSVWCRQFDGGYIVTLPAGNGMIPDVLGCIEGLPQNRLRPLLLLLLCIKE